MHPASRCKPLQAAKAMHIADGQVALRVPPRVRPNRRVAFAQLEAFLAALPGLVTEHAAGEAPDAEAEHNMQQVQEAGMIEVAQAYSARRAARRQWEMPKVVDIGKPLVFDA